MIITITSIAAAATCNAVMDILSHHYYFSIFEVYKKPKYWNPEISWRNKYNGGDPAYGRKKWFYGMFTMHVAFTDAWHLFKSLMIVFLCLGMIFAPTSGGWIQQAIMFCSYGLTWNLFFNMFYKVILRK